METSSDHSPKNVKLRRPWGVVALGILTLGIYLLVWYYKVNREMRDFGIERGDSVLAKSRPWVSLLAVTFGVLLVVPPLVSQIRTALRVRSVEGLATGSARPAGGVITLLVISSFVPAILLTALARAVAGPIAADVVSVLCVAGLLIAYGLIQSRLNAAWRAVVPTSEGAFETSSLVV